MSLYSSLQALPCAGALLCAQTANMMQHCIMSHPNEANADGNNDDENGWREYIVRRSMTDGSGDDDDPLLDDMSYYDDGTVRSY